jgi:hypothetical protein
VPKKIVAFECEGCGAAFADRAEAVSCEATHAPAKPCPFRAVGFTADAINYPLSPAGQKIIADHNGVLVDQLPPGFRYSSGPGMHRWIETLGELLLVGACVRDDDGRWWTLARLEAAYGPLEPLSHPTV